MTNAEIRKFYKAKGQTPDTMQQWWAFVEAADPALRARIREVQNGFNKAGNRLRDYKMSFRHRTKIRQYCNLHFPNDAYPWEVIKVVSPITVHVREMDAILLNPKDLVFHPGGFVAHCSNTHAQRWAYTQNHKNEVRILRLGKQGWGKGMFHMSDTPYKFYDYNL